MNVLITGGTGFIGTRLALRCLERGDKVRVLGQINTPVEENNKRQIESQGAELILASVTDKNVVDKAVQGIDVVFHLAAIQHEMNIPDQKFREVNVEGTKNVLDACVQNGVGCFVHGSTIGVYGALAGVIDEQSPRLPDNIYGETKLEGEQLTLSYADRLAISVIRIPEVYGPGDRRLLKLFKAIESNKFFIIGSGVNLHHLIYVDDLIDGLFLMADSPEAVGEVFLIAGERAVTTREMATTIADCLGVRLPLWSAPLWPFMLAATILEKTLRPLGIQPPLHRRRMDFFVKGFSFTTEKAESVLKFVAKTGFSAGVEKTAAWYKAQNLLAGKKKSNGTEGEFSHMLTGSEQVARMEPFDSFWEAPQDVEKGYKSFGQFYRTNYLPYIPRDKNSRTLIVSCGPGYFVNLLKDEGYKDVLGIDSDPQKAAYAVKNELNCREEKVFPFLKNNQTPYDLIVAEQELNHLTKDEMIDFLQLCHQNLSEKGRVIVHSLNGANPITGAEALAQNFDHYNTLTEYSLKQVLEFSGFEDSQAFPLNLYVFYRNPLNYIAMLVHFINLLFFRFNFKLYGKANRIFTKKIAAVAYKSRDFE